MASTVPDRRPELENLERKAVEGTGVVVVAEEEAQEARVVGVREGAGAGVEAVENIVVHDDNLSEVEEELIVVVLGRG